MQCAMEDQIHPLMFEPLSLPITINEYRKTQHVHVVSSPPTYDPHIHPCLIQTV